MTGDGGGGIGGGSNGGIDGGGSGDVVVCRQVVRCPSFHIYLQSDYYRPEPQRRQ